MLSLQAKAANLANSIQYNSIVLYILSGKIFPPQGAFGVDIPEICAMIAQTARRYGNGFLGMLCFHE